MALWVARSGKHGKFEEKFLDFGSLAPVNFTALDASRIYSITSFSTQASVSPELHEAQ